MYLQQPDIEKDKSKCLSKKQDELNSTIFFEKTTKDFTYVDPKVA